MTSIPRHPQHEPYFNAGSEKLARAQMHLFFFFTDWLSESSPLTQQAAYGSSHRPPGVRVGNERNDWFTLETTRQEEYSL